MSLLSRTFMPYPIPRKTNHDTGNQEQRQLSKRVTPVHFPSTKQLFLSFYKRVSPDIFPLESRHQTESTYHTIFNKTRFVIPFCLLLTDNILSYISLEGAELNFHYPNVKTHFCHQRTQLVYARSPFINSTSFSLDWGLHSAKF